MSNLDVSTRKESALQNLVQPELRYCVLFHLPSSKGFCIQLLSIVLLKRCTRVASDLLALR